MATLSSQERRRLAEALGEWVERIEADVRAPVSRLNAPEAVSPDTLVTIAGQALVELSTVLGSLVIATLESTPGWIEGRTATQAFDAEVLDQLLSQIAGKSDVLTTTVLAGIEESALKTLTHNPQFAAKARELGVTTPEELARSARRIAGNTAQELRSTVEEVVALVLAVVRESKSRVTLETHLKSALEPPLKRASAGKAPEFQFVKDLEESKPWWRFW